MPMLASKIMAGCEPLTYHPINYDRGGGLQKLIFNVLKALAGKLRIQNCCNS